MTPIKTPPYTLVSKNGLFQGEFDPLVPKQDAQDLLDRHESSWLLTKGESTFKFIGERD